MIDATIDDKEFKARLQIFLAAMGGAQRLGLFAVGSEVMRLSQIEVPHDEGTLQNSGTVEVDGDNIIVGYHTPYAARLHEHPEYRFKKGRKGKYLEDPIHRNADILGLTMTKRVEKALPFHV